MNEKVELGDRVEDKISGLKGIAIGITDWLYGCRRISVQPEQSKDGQPVSSFSVDEPQVVIIKKRVIVPPGAVSLEKKKETPEPRTHGPQPDPVRYSNAARREV